MNARKGDIGRPRTTQRRLLAAALVLSRTCIRKLAKFVAVCAPLGGLFSISPAQAAYVIFNDQAAFQAATGATSATGPLPSLGFLGSVATTINNITYRAPNGLWVGGRALSTLIPNAIGINDIENLDVSSIAPVYAMGIQAHEPSASGIGVDLCGVFSGCIDATFTITIKSGSTTVGTETVNFPDDTLAFFGVWSDQPFDRFEIREPSGQIDNEFFGQVFTSSTPVPEPGTLPLFGLGLAGLMACRRRTA